MAQIGALITFSPNTIIKSADTNSNNTTVKSTYNAHDVAVTAVHGITGNVVGTSDAQNLTNKTLTSPAIVSPTVTSGLDLQSGDLKVASTQKVYLDSGFNTYLTESAVDTVGVYTNGTLGVQVDSANVAVGSTRDFAVAATKKVYLDGGSDTYIKENVANEIGFYTNGNGRMFLNEATGLSLVGENLTIDSVKRFYVDGGGDSYLTESGANILDFVVGAVSAFTISSASVIVGSIPLKLQPTQKLYLDGGGDTYIYESAGNVLDIYVGGVNALKANSGAVTISDLTVSTLKRNAATGTGVDSSTTSGIGVLGQATTGQGLYGSASSAGYGVYGSSSTGIGVYGVTSGGAGSYGVSGSAGAGGGEGVHAYSADSYGLHAQNNNANPCVFAEGLNGGAGVSANSNTNVGVRASGGNASYNFYGDNAGNTNIGQASSIRWKSNIREIPNALDAVMSIRGVVFDWDEEHGGATDRMGFIAEEVYSAVPYKNVVCMDKDNPEFADGMDYASMTPLLLQAIKEQQKQIEELKLEIEKLK